MRVVRDLELVNFRNIKNSKLEDLRDLNILIGPNNSGKTNILTSIDLLKNLSLSGFSEHDCSLVSNFWNNINWDKERRFKINGLILNTNKNESYRRDSKFKITYNFDKDFLDEIFKKKHGISIDKFIDMLKDLGNSVIRNVSLLDINIYRAHLNDIIAGLTSLTMNQSEDRNSTLAHISILSAGNIIDDIKNKIVFCPDSRYDFYKGSSISEYILNSRPRKDDEAKLIEFIRFIIDSKIRDRIIDMTPRKISFLRLLENEEFETLIDEQGSGIKSLVCLAWDIIRSKKGSIILVDEPEIGINPSVKQEFLKFLIKESKEKQIFISTHDPTFVNPIFWDRNNVAVYLYSLPNENFVKINLDENNENPNIFAGYLPHTVSVKDIHFYVEGSYDVYIFQIFLQKFLKRVSKEQYEIIKKEWYEILNKIGIYHLGGDFWSHLLYTIPKIPYKTIVILDGDKKSEAEKIIKRYDESRLENLPTFVFCTSLLDLVRVLKEGNCPVYCLTKDNIEKYLDPKPSNKDEGPKVADKMENVPEEITNIFINTLNDILKITQ